jgi:crossover junction endodeoxyribonuclease RusA
MTDVLKFRVPGLPRPEGSLRVGKHGKLFHAKDKDLQEWRYAIAWRARKIMRERAIPLTAGPVIVIVEFIMYRPKSTPKRKPTPPAIKYPDVDKLERAVLDSLTGHVYQDDSQVIALLGFERLAEADERVGAIIEIHLGDANVYERQRFRAYLRRAIAEHLS